MCTYSIQGVEFDAFTDNCSDGSITIGNGTATLSEIFDKGATEITWTVDDGNGQIVTCTTTITVLDNEVPVITCVESADRDTDPRLCTYSIQGVEFDATFTDNCSDGSITNSRNGTATLSGEIFDKGATEITWTVDDGNGQIVTCTTTITVLDNEVPVITCVESAARDTDPGLCTYSIQGVEFDATFTDNCSDGSITNSRNGTATLSGEIFDKGATEITWTVDDGNGQIVTCTTIITVLDNEVPVITCVESADRDTDPGLCTYSIQGVEFDATFTDNCSDGSITNSRNGTATLSGEIFDKGATEITWTVDDGNGQIVTCTTTITVLDNEVPVITCVSDQERYIDPYQTYYTVQGIEFDATATDNCTIATITYVGGTPNASGSTMDNVQLDLGVNTMDWTAVDVNGNESYCTTVITVKKRPTTLTYTGDIVEQYSDNVDLSATLIDDVSGNGVQGKTITFTIGSQTTTAVSNVSGIASITLILDQNPAGTYTVKSQFLEDAGYLGSVDEDGFDITQEDAIVSYTGQSLQATPSSRDSEATVILSANIQDITINPGNDLHDPYQGHILNARLKFVDREGTFDSGWLDVNNLIDPVTGTVSYNWIKDIGNQTSESFTIGIIVDTGYYIRDSSEDDTVVTIYKPVGDFITGGGYIIPDASAGQYASTDGLKTNFGFNVKYNKKGTKLKGHMNVIFRSLESDGIVHVYQIKSNAVQSLGVDVSDENDQFATFITKSNLKDITDPLNTISLGGNLILKVDMHDRGEPGSEDSISFNLTEGNFGELLYSSNWTGIFTAEMQLSGGNLVVHSGISVGDTNTTTTTAARVLDVNDSDHYSIEVKSWPNPSDAYFNLKVISTNSVDDVNILVFDVNNKLVHKGKFKPLDEYQFGRNLEGGTYIVKLSQADKVQSVRLVKY